MFNPADRIKVAVRKHKSKIVFSAGVVTGVSAVVVFRRNVPVHITAPISSSELQHLIDHTEDAMSYVSLKPLAVVELFNAIHLEKK
jgi:hypothetical protein